MQNNAISKISPIVRILVLFILIISLLIAKSIFLILFITNFTLILAILTGKKVNFYVNMFKKFFWLLLFFLTLYIIIFKQVDILLMILLLFKFIIIFILISIFFVFIDFNSLHQSIYVLIYPFKKLNINIENLSLDIVLTLYFINYLFDSKIEIKNRQLLRGRTKINIKNFVLPRLIYSSNKINEFQNNLQLKFYKLNHKQVDLKSFIILLIFISMFVICLIKEVIL